MIAIHSAGCKHRAMLVGAFVCAIVLCTIMANCGGSPSGSSGGTQMPTASLSANPTAYTAGGSPVVLSFSSTNASSGVINPGANQVGLGPGTFNVSPTANTTYTYTATGPGGTAMASASITVTQPAVPTITLSANPTGVVAGEGVTLTWASTNATSVVITASVGASPGGVQLNGSVTVPPLSATTTYTAVASGANGTQPASTAIIVQVNPIVSFNGMNYSQVSGGTGQTDIDPNGAVGTKQFMEYVNTSYQAYDKITQTPVWPTPQPIGTPWTGNKDCAGASIQLDAVIIFDKLANVWVIAGKTTKEDHYYFCIAVSNTDDLTSTTLAWYTYGISLDTSLGLNAEGQVYLPDWPKISTWPDAYYATMDLNDPNNGQSQAGVLVCAFDRTDLLINGTVKTPICFNDQNSLRMSNGIYLAHSLIPADVDGTTPPPAGRDEFLVSIENPANDGTSTTSNTFNLWDFHVNWATPSLSTFTQSSIVVSPYTPGCYDPSGPALTNCVPEPGVTLNGVGVGQKVDSVGDRIMPRFAYRNFGTYESFLMSQTVQTELGTGQNSTQTGILWYELRGSGTPTIHQQGLISPDATYFRFLPSIVQDHVGNAAVGYSISNTFSNPGIAASLWNLPSNSTPTELTLINGPGEEVTTTAPYDGQWGTYSAMTIDPTDDCTFWYVNEYWMTIDSVPADDEWSTQISSFKVPNCQ